MKISIVMGDGDTANILDVSLAKLNKLVELANRTVEIERSQGKPNYDDIELIALFENLIAKAEE